MLLTIFNIYKQLNIVIICLKVERGACYIGFIFPFRHIESGSRKPFTRGRAA